MTLPTTSTVPAPSTLTSAPMRHRLRVELDATPAEVWALVGDHTRLPDYSAGIATVLSDGSTRTCVFRGPDGAPTGPQVRERIRWEEAGVGYATSAEPANDFGIENGLSLVTVEVSGRKTLMTWLEHYDAADLPTLRASYDDGLADIAARLVARFGGRVLERFVDG